VKSLLADDEAAARSRLARLLAEHEAVEIVGEAADGLETVAKIESLRPELLFLDIEMPGLSGFQVLQSIPKTVPLPLVVFVTGYDEHALAAFEANALAYLLKPVEPGRLALAVERAIGLHAVRKHEDAELRRLRRVSAESPQLLQQVVCRKRDHLILLPPEQVHWFQAEHGIVKARTATESYWVNYQLGQLERSLPPDLFFRARREVLVNVTKIKEIRSFFKSGFLLVMADAAATEIAVSERNVPPLRQRMPGL
jgi:two-component system, LytTR family, response regulator